MTPLSIVLLVNGVCGLAVALLNLRLSREIGKVVAESAVAHGPG